MTGQNLTRLTARDPMLHLFLRFGQTLRRHTRHLCSFQGVFWRRTYRHFKADSPARPPGASAGINTVPPLAQLP